MSIIILSSAIEQSLLLLPIVLGVYLSYSVLKITDLTVDASFVLGAAVYARICIETNNPVLGLIVAILAGIITGIVIAVLQSKLKLDPLLISIVALFMFYSINFNILGKPNINLQNTTNLEQLLNINIYIILAVLCLFIVIGVAILLKSNVGLCLRAFGQNKELLNLLSNKVEIYRMLGLGISNGLAAFSGLMTAETNGFADLNMGFGIALIAIGSIVIGAQIKLANVNINSGYKFFSKLMKCFIGVLLYFFLLNLLLKININPINLKLILGVILIIFLKMNNNKSYYGEMA